MYNLLHSLTVRELSHNKLTKLTEWNFRFSQQNSFKSWSSRYWHHVVWYMVTNVSEENTFRILWKCRLYCFPNAGNTEPDYKDYSQDHNIKLWIIYVIQLLSVLRQIQVLYTKHLCKVAFLKETLHFKSTVHWGVQYCTLPDLTNKHAKENLHINTRVLQNMTQWHLPKETALYLCTNTETYWDLAFWSDTSVVW